MIRSLLTLLSALCLSLHVFGVTFGWNGNGDGLNWDDPNNWEDMMMAMPGVPGVGDIAVITPFPASAPATVQIRNAQFAQSVEISMGSTLNIVSGSLTINNNNTGDGIDIDDGNLNISAGAVVTIDSTFDHGIIASGPVQINNAGTLVINNSAQFGLEFFLVASNVTLINDGTFTISNYGDEAISIDGDGSFTNNGTLNIDQNGTYQGDEAIDLDGINASFTNNGTINIVDVDLVEAIDISGLFTNNCLINVGNKVTNTDNAIQVKAPNGRLNNAMCGVINVTSGHPIDNKGIIENSGIITTVFTGENDNDATFINNSVIASPNGIFRLEVGNNPILGFGSIRPDPIPAPFNYICSKGTPTLS